MSVESDYTAKLGSQVDSLLVLGDTVVGVSVSTGMWRIDNRLCLAVAMGATVRSTRALDSKPHFAVLM